jgi:undecaprenyl diphosphate synthase
MTLKEQIDRNRLPNHVAVIMDGNGRWAKKKGLMRVFGHQNGVKAVRETVEAAAEIGVSYLTLYAFSTENWNRPKSEVDALMELLISTLSKELGTLMENDIRLETIGDFDALPGNCQVDLQKVMEKTQSNKRMTLILALSYSARWECVQAVRRMAEIVKNGDLNPEDITEQTVNDFMTTKNYPDPELLIRTSGELRISNFLLWQIAYTELYFTEVLWPDFRKNDFYKALLDFQKRERRFGKTSEQIKDVNEVS